MIKHETNGDTIKQLLFFLATNFYFYCRSNLASAESKTIETQTQNQSPPKANASVHSKVKRSTAKTDGLDKLVDELLDSPFLPALTALASAKRTVSG